jgi:acylphosphatase
MAEGENKARARVRVYGRVQGVFFRASAENEARRRGVTGWVRNCPNGSVELVAEGPKAKLEEFIAWCHRGPAHAEVERIEVDWENSTGEFTNFRTAG